VIDAAVDGRAVPARLSAATVTDSEGAFDFDSPIRMDRAKLR